MSEKVEKKLPVLPALLLSHSVFHMISHSLKHHLLFFSPQNQLEHDLSLREDVGPLTFSVAIPGKYNKQSSLGFCKSLIMFTVDTKCSSQGEKLSLIFKYYVGTLATKHSIMSTLAI